MADDNSKEKPIQLIIDEINSQSDRIITYHLAAFYLEDIQKIYWKIEMESEQIILKVSVKEISEMMKELE